MENNEDEITSVKASISGALFVRFVKRVTGRAYPVRDLAHHQERHGRLAAHVESEWTTPDHWAHNNYERSHLPQLCVRASGWKARVIALILWPKSPWEPWK